jgi:hypothetical protein
VVDGVRHCSELTHEDLVINHHYQAEVEHRRMYVLQGISGDARTLKLNDPNIDTLASALLERMYYCKVDGKFVEPPPVDVKHVFKTLSQFRGIMLRRFGMKPSRNSPEQFVEMYTGRKRTIYEHAATELHLNGVTRRDARSNSFVKCEKVNPLKAPRCIQPRTPVYNVSLGTYLKHIEHKLYNAIQRTFQSDTPIIIKGYNVVDSANILRSKWDTFRDPVAVGLDATKFDMHVSHAMLKWEHSIYEHLYNGDTELKKLLKWQRNNVGRGYCKDGSLKYKVKGRRFSGDMNTSLGNCIIMCGMIYAFAKEKGVSIELANNGDDCVIFMEREKLNTFMANLDQWFYNLGFRMTVETPVTEFEHIEFCQTHPIKLNRGWTMVRNFNTAREKDSISLIDISMEQAAMKWMGAVGECGLALTGGCPVFQSFYLAYSRNGIKSNVLNSVQMQSGFLMMSRGLESKMDEITDEARASFYYAFDVTPDEQVALEEYYDAWTYKHTLDHVGELREIDVAPI